MGQKWNINNNDFAFLRAKTRQTHMNLSVAIMLSYRNLFLGQSETEKSFGDKACVLIFAHQKMVSAAWKASRGLISESPSALSCGHGHRNSNWSDRTTCGQEHRLKRKPYTAPVIYCLELTLCGGSLSTYHGTFVGFDFF